MDNASDSLPCCELKTENAESDPDQRLELDHVVQAGDWSVIGDLKTLLARISRSVCNHVRLPAAHCEAVVALSDDASVRQLNLTYRGKDKPTNVLSFPGQLAEHGKGPLFLGDIVLASQTLAGEASAGSVSERDHLAHLVVHGILHLIGFDHDRDSDADVMETIETAILAELNISDPYKDPQFEEAADQPG